MVAPVRLDSFRLAARLRFCGFLYTTFLGQTNQSYFTYGTVPSNVVFNNLDLALDSSIGR